MKTMQLMVAETESDRGTLDSANDDDEFRRRIAIL